MTNHAINTRLPGFNSGIALLLIVFCVSLLPVLPQVSTYHSDEQFYTDSAIYMLHHSDYLTPHYADGALRTKKPILTYWVLIGAYWTLGIGFFAARLPFLIAGAGTLWLTYLFARKLFQRHRVALLAAAILAGNMQFIVLSLRSTPDILQTFFMTMSLYGFAALALYRDARLRNYLLTYIGAALAVQTKGLLGVVLLVFMVVYILLATERMHTAKLVTHWPVMAAAFVIALSWYLYIYFRHGGEALWRFYTDQVGGKVDKSILDLFINIKDYIWGLFRNFLPWSLIVSVGYPAGRKGVHDFVGRHRRTFVFLSGWLVLLLAIFAGSSDNRTRYLAPAYPMVSLMLAALFWEVYENRHIRRWWRWGGGLLLILVGIPGCILLWIGAVLDWHLALGGAVLAGGSAWGLRDTIKRTQGIAPVTMGLILLVTLAALRALVWPPLEFAPSKSLAACLLPEIESGRVRMVWSGRRANYLRQLYTLSRGRIRVDYYSGGRLPENLDRSAVVVLTREDKERLGDGSFDFQPCGAVFQEPDPAAVWRGLLGGDKSRVMAAIRQPLFLARSRDGT